MLIGPNASGKSHILRALRDYFQENRPLLSLKKIHFLSSRRIYELEHYQNQIQEQPEEHTISSDYEALQYKADLLLKVRAKLSEFFKRDMMITWGANGLNIQLSRQDAMGETYSVHQEASGLIHITSLLSAIYNDEIGVLLIDEPELSLHPQYQSFLLNEIYKVTGLPHSGQNKKIIIIGTHSPEFIDLQHPENLSSLCFCEDLMQKPRQILSLKEINRTFIQRIGYQYKKALFAKNILLLEGATDELICNSLARKWNFSLEVNDAQIIAVNSKNDLIPAYYFFDEIGKKITILADSDWIIDELEEFDRFIHRRRIPLKIKPLILAAMHIPYPDPETTFNEFRQHTYYKDSYETILKQLPTHLNTAQTILDTLNTLPADDNLKNSFNTAFSRFNFCFLLKLGVLPELHTALELLNQQNIYIFTQGEIESYYQTKPDRKRAWAYTEIDHIEQESDETLQKRFREVYMALKRLVARDTVSELDFVHSELDTLANNIRRAYEKPNYHAIIQIQRNCHYYGIFTVDTDNIQQNVHITLKSIILNVQPFSLLIEAKDDANTVTQNVKKALNLPIVS